MANCFLEGVNIAIKTISATLGIFVTLMLCCVPVILVSRITIWRAEKRLRKLESQVEITEPNLSVIAELDPDKTYIVGLPLPPDSSADNIKSVLTRLNEAYRGYHGRKPEIIFVDGSKEYTVEEIKEQSDVH